MSKRSGSAARDLKLRSNWLGGYYELAIKLGPAGGQLREPAVRALADAAGLTDYEDLATGTSAWDELRTVAAIPNLGDVVCALIFVREEDGTEPRYDCLNLCLPIGALSVLGEFDNWAGPVEDWFGHIARAVFDAAPFEYALTGEEVSGTTAQVAQQEGIRFIRPTGTGVLRDSRS